MGTKKHKRLMTALVVSLLSGSAGFTTQDTTQAAPASQPGGFAHTAFSDVWMRTDFLTDNGAVKRSYYWGPAPGFSAYEEYAEGQGGKRLVQYFDKSRMEINDPGADRDSPFYVTNGLLTVELITGKMQTGNNSFEQRHPAEINLASDSDDTGTLTPTYASFRSAYSFRMGDRSGETIIDTINRVGLVGTDTRYEMAGVKYAHFEPITRHNIPDVFWSFLNARGPVVEEGKTVEARLSDPWFYATGYPITDAYWASVKIGETYNTSVLIQAYERRVLTYVPSFADAFKVQMGNIGRHYYDWRYGVQPATPVPIRCAQVPTRGFGKVWADNPQVQAQLGCPHTTERQVFVAYQPFERGQMIDVIERYGNSEFKTIYVLFGDGSVQRFQDTYRDGDPEPTVTPSPPPGLFAPARGFGKVWREGTGARVRERLGWATAREVGSPEGATLIFQKGQMVYAGPQVKKIFVLYNEQGFGAYELTRWAVYDDTYRP